MRMVEDIFKNKFPNWEKLCEFGFVKEKRSDVYECSRTILNGQFVLTVEISLNGLVKTKLIDVDTSEEYVLHRVAAATGAYVGAVRAEYNGVLQKIADNCFENRVYHHEVTLATIRYIGEKYGDKQEFLWQKFPEDSVFRRKGSDKWYALFLIVARNKIGLEGDEKIEILDVRVKTEDLEKIIDNKKFFPAYHMNKKSWLTVCLDGSVAEERIFSLIDESYRLAK